MIITEYIRSGRKEERGLFKTQETLWSAGGKMDVLYGLYHHYARLRCVDNLSSGRGGLHHDRISRSHQGLDFYRNNSWMEAMKVLGTYLLDQASPYLYDIRLINLYGFISFSFLPPT